MTVDDVLVRYTVSLVDLYNGRPRYRMPDDSLVCRAGARNDLAAPLVRQPNAVSMCYTTDIYAITEWGTRKTRKLGDTVTITRDVDTSTWLWRLTIEAQLSIQTTATVRLRERENTLALMALDYVNGDECGPMLLDYFKDFLLAVSTAY